MVKINWHRLFGLIMMDYLSHRGFRVELEKDLSLKRQYLDVVIVEREDGEPDLTDICDGFDNLSRHNLLSYKSKRQSLNAWALEELIGHYVNYRKVIGKSQVRADDIRLYAISTMRPDSLLALTGATAVKPGVFELQVVSRVVRILVLSELTLSQRNAVLAFFSFNAEKVGFALEHYDWQQDDGSTVINQLLEQYSLEGIDMPYTMEQFKKDYLRSCLADLDPEEILSMFEPEVRLKGLKPKDRLKGLKPEDRLKGLKPEDRFQGLSPEDIEAYLKKIKKRKTRENQ